MTSDQIIKNHREQMARQKFSIYQSFDPLEQADLQPEAIASLRQEISQLIGRP